MIIKLNFVVDTSFGGWVWHLFFQMIQNWISSSYLQCLIQDWPEFLWKKHIWQISQKALLEKGHPFFGVNSTDFHPSFQVSYKVFKAAFDIKCLTQKVMSILFWNELDKEGYHRKHEESGLVTIFWQYYRFQLHGCWLKLMIFVIYHWYS